MVVSALKPHSITSKCGVDSETGGNLCFAAESAPLLIFCALAAVQWSVEMVVLGALPPRSQVQRAEKSHKTSSGLCSLPPPSAPRVCPGWASGARRHRHPTTDSAIVSLRLRWMSPSLLRRLGPEKQKGYVAFLARSSCPHRKKDWHCWSSSNLRQWYLSLEFLMGWTLLLAVIRR